MCLYCRNPKDKQRDTKAKNETTEIEKIKLPLTPSPQYNEIKHKKGGKKNISRPKPTGKRLQHTTECTTVLTAAKEQVNTHRQKQARKHTKYTKQDKMASKTYKTQKNQQKRHTQLVRRRPRAKWTRPNSKLPTFPSLLPTTWTRPTNKTRRPNHLNKACCGKYKSVSLRILR